MWSTQTRPNQQRGGAAGGLPDPTFFARPHPHPMMICPALACLLALLSSARWLADWIGCPDTYDVQYCTCMIARLNFFFCFFLISAHDRPRLAQAQVFRPALLIWLLLLLMRWCGRIGRYEALRLLFISYLNKNEYSHVLTLSIPSVKLLRTHTSGREDEDIISSSSSSFTHADALYR